MSMKRLLLVLLALVLALAPALAGGSSGGEGGWINVPGGGGGGCHLNGPTSAPRVEAVRAFGDDIALRLAPELEGSVAWIVEPATGAVTTMATVNGTLVLSGEELMAMVEAGVKSLLVMVVAPNQATVNITIDFQVETSTALVRVW